MMPVLIEVMLNREKPLITGEGIKHHEEIALHFPAQKLSVNMSGGDYEEFLETPRSDLLDTCVHQKNQLIQAKLDELKALQKKFNENKTDSLRVDARAAYLVLSREIAAQQELYDSSGSSQKNDFYGKVAAVVVVG
jgi:hypothetical protein